MPHTRVIQGAQSGGTGEETALGHPRGEDGDYVIEAGLATAIIERPSRTGLPGMESCIEEEYHSAVRAGDSDLWRKRRDEGRTWT